MGNSTESTLSCCWNDEVYGALGSRNVGEGGYPGPKTWAEACTALLDASAGDNYLASDQGGPGRSTTPGSTGAKKR